ncbi:MAG: hypothetical protein K2L81_04010, partial [Muribaculaceae bacterium]|nr:hypothetical protein [Muribaculaceae bacterium]
MNSDNSPIKKPTNSATASAQSNNVRKQPTRPSDNDDELVVLSAEPAPARAPKRRKDLWLNNDEETKVAPKSAMPSHDSSKPKAKKGKKKDNRNFFQRHIILFNVLIMICVGLI